MKILDLIAERLSEKYELHDHYLNGQLVRLLKTIGYDVAYTAPAARICSTARATATSTCSRAGACSLSAAITPSWSRS